MAEKLQAKVNAQADLIRHLKKQGMKNKDPELLKEVEKLQILKKLYEDAISGKDEAAAAEEKARKDTREGLASICTKRFFYVPSFEIYRGVAGLYDFGPAGSAVKQNILAAWRKHFVLEENMLEVDCVSVTPHQVLKTSGHVDRFTDFMVKDLKTGDCHRADHLLEGHVEAELKKGGQSEQLRKEMLSDASNADAFSRDELAAVLKKYKIKSPDTGNELSEPFAFNLMFGTQIGPTGKFQGYLRPETAQGIFVNFKRLLEYNNGQMPFAAAQIGLGFRNEIAPRAGLLRVREFPMAEIEHFVHPQKKDHPKFASVAKLSLRLLPKALQTGEDNTKSMEIGQAVAQGIVANQTLGYFLARTHQFLVSIGIKEDGLRFRQHKETEMAHYACDCWDAEIKTTYGWIEVAGHADRSAYDLDVHSKESKENLQAWEQFPEPILVDTFKLEYNKGAIGKTLKGAAKNALAYLYNIEQPGKEEEVNALVASLQKNGKVDVEGITLTADQIKFKPIQRKQSGRNYTPNVIEPSFGIGRILYSVLEHSYELRGIEEKTGMRRAILALKPSIAPVKVGVYPMADSPGVRGLVTNLVQQITSFGFSSKVDDSGVGIGRKYARGDEIGVPFALTIDFETEKDGALTVRERDSMQQIRVNLKDVTIVLASLLTETISWAEACKKYPMVERPGSDGSD